MQNVFSFLRLNKKKKTLKSIKSIVSEGSSQDITKKPTDKSKTSVLSAIEVQKEETEQEKNDRILNSIITKFKDDKKTDIQNCCIENSKKDIEFLTKMDTVITELTNFNFTSPKEEGEKCQLVEKNYVDTLRDENEKYMHSIQKYESKISQIKTELFKATGENNFVKQASDYQNAQKTDNAKQLANMEKMLNDCKAMNKQLRDELTTKQIQKDSLFRAVYNSFKRFNEDMADEFKVIYQNYNNQLFMISNKGDDEKKIDELFSQINLLERKIASKNKEIKELQRFMIPEKKVVKKKPRRTYINAQKS